jgi:hypothetical protein
MPGEISNRNNQERSRDDMKEQQFLIRLADLMAAEHLITPDEKVKLLNLIRKDMME